MQRRCLFFLSLTLFAGLSYAQTPRLVLGLSATTVTVGEQLSANCTATTNTQSRALYVNGESVSPDRWSSISEGNTTTWTIDSVQRQDAGEYYCFSGGDQTSHLDSLRQNVTVYFSPDATIAMPAATVQSDDVAEVVIFVEALPVITSVQFILPSPLANSPSYSPESVTSGNVTITFSSVNRYNNGMYTANFTNDIGSDTVDFELTVYYGPYFSYEGEEQVNGVSIDVTFAEGQEVILVCEVTATNPAVSSLMQTEPPNANNVEFDEGTGTITITGATAANEGTYTCSADNGETTPTTISFLLRMDSSPSETTATPTSSAGNLLATVSVAVVMLLATIFLS